MSYGRVTAPFSRAKKGDFHEVPFIDDADNILTRGDGPDQDKSGLVYFSPCERQALLEHIIEGKIREAVHMKILSPLTDIQVGPPCTRAFRAFLFFLPVYGCPFFLPIYWCAKAALSANAIHGSTPRIVFFAVFPSARRRWRRQPRRDLAEGQLGRVGS